MKILFQTTIEHLLKSHNQLETFQTQDHFHLRLNMPHFDRLVIERHGELISVSHYFEQNGDLVPDPDVELHYPSWIPTSITQCMGYRREKFIERDGKTFVDRHFHAEVSAFLSMWARNIKAQKWAENGKIHNDARD